MVKRAEEYEWSSAVCHCGIRTDVNLMLLPAITESIHDWSKWLAEEGDQEQIKRIRNNTKTGFPCGSNLFVKELEIILGRPIKRGQVGRPKRVGMEEQMPIGLHQMDLIKK
jgi:putative transposase